MVSHNSFEEEAEGCLLGSILLNSDALSKVEHVETSDFGSFLHRAIFETIRELVADGTAIDTMTVAGRLFKGTAAGVFCDKDHVSQTLTRCLESVPNAAHADHYAAQVIEASRRRSAMQFADELADSIRTGSDFAELIQERLPGLTALAKGERRLASRLTVRCLADVVPRKLEWLWPGLLPLGKLSLFCGDPGLGKSFVTCDLAARVSRGGAWPNGEATQPAGSVLILACEDDVEDTIRPRLDDAAADVSRIHVIDSVCVRNKERGFALDADMPLLKQEVERLGDVRLLIIDPISAYCGKADTHRNSEVRTMLAPLTELAAESQFAVVGINHLTKGGGKAVYRGMGSIAFNAAARAVVNFYRDPEDEDRRLIVTTKMNLTAESCGLAYRIEDGVVVWDDDPVDLTADELETLEAAGGGKAKGAAGERAKEFLYATLINGEMTFDELLEAAGKLSISASTLKRARKEIRCIKRKDGMTGPVYWRLPDDALTEL
jgi:putative DNA primase/helicase